MRGGRPDTETDFPAPPPRPAAFAEEAAAQTWEWRDEAAQLGRELGEARRNYARIGAQYGKASRVIARQKVDLTRARAALRDGWWWRAGAFIAGGCAVGFAPAALRAAAVLWGAPS